MLRVAFVGPLSASFAGRVRAHLAEPAELVFTGEADAVGVMPDVDVLVTLVFTRPMGAAATRLKLVQVPGAGLDRIARDALPDGTALANAYGHDVGIAEYVLARCSRSTAASSRSTPPCAAGSGTVSGRSACRRPRSSPSSAARPSSSSGTAASARRWRGARALGAMKPTAALINVARAGIVDETALYHALRDRRIAAAALDVWYRYPTDPGPTAPSQHPFHELPNVLMTPHVSGWTDGTLEARATLIAENIGRVRRGEPPLNPIPTR